MNLFIAFFGCGKVNIRANNSRCDFYVQDFTKIYTIIIPHFKDYPLYNIKTLDFLDFKKAANLFNIDGKNSIEPISNIISNMISRRIY
jgi:hypothetical protein